MEKIKSTHGYYHASISLETGKPLLHTNSERAYVIAQLQDLLSPRLILGDVPAYRQLASCIDLFGFSITPKSIELVLFAIDISLTVDFIQRVMLRTIQYQSERVTVHPDDWRQNIMPLAGAHQALEHTIELHLRHPDWEYDRYSSIGFFLHDRRGDWMRLWRITKLYGNSTEKYRELIMACLQPQRVFNEDYGGNYAVFGKPCDITA